MTSIDAKPHRLSQLRFEDGFLRAVPGDASRDNAPRLVPGACYTRVEPTPAPAPRLLAWSDALAAALGIERPAAPCDETVRILAGNASAPGMAPYAARYGGHQFGNWAGQLGDGRAMTLGELPARDGRYELQLKGAGATPYCRMADGRAVLRSSLREFLCSEAMHHLGVPTTRALSLVATGEAVTRDMLEDGHPRDEPGAVVCRVAPSFLRFGNFEIHAAHDEHAALERLADYTIREHFPELDTTSPERYARWFEEVCRRTAVMIAHWMRVGFVHGVMNTDNMSILGLTIDYGPYGWLEGYDPGWTPNTTDAVTRRYCFGNQPGIGEWNLRRLAAALHPLIGETAPLEQGLATYRSSFEQSYAAMIADKLGLETLGGDGDDALLDELSELLASAETDTTIFFRRLTELPIAAATQEAAPGDERLLRPLQDAFYDGSGISSAHREALAGWLRRYARRVRLENRDPAARRRQMDAANPKYVPRNYLAQQAIDAAEDGDTGPLERLLRVLRRPYDEQPGEEALAAKRPEWARHRPGCSMLSCSS